jgi:hypothetical protein
LVVEKFLGFPGSEELVVSAGRKAGANGFNREAKGLDEEVWCRLLDVTCNIPGSGALDKTSSSEVDLLSSVCSDMGGEICGVVNFFGRR